MSLKNALTCLALVNFKSNEFQSTGIRFRISNKDYYKFKFPFKTHEMDLTFLLLVKN